MLYSEVFKSKGELIKYMDDHIQDIDLMRWPDKYPCVGFVCMCADESYDMRFLYREDVSLLMRWLEA